MDNFDVIFTFPERGHLPSEIFARNHLFTPPVTILATTVAGSYLRAPAFAGVKFNGSLLLHVIALCV